MRPLDGYPTSWGSSRASVFPHAGPTLYAPIVEGVAPALATGGDEVEAIEAGLKYFDVVIGGETDSGKYRVEAIPEAVSGVVGSSSPSAGQPSTKFRLRWFLAATGVEAGAVNLSAEIVRLTGIGPK